MGQSLAQAIQILAIYGYATRLDRGRLFAKHNDSVEWVLRVRDGEVNPFDVQRLIDAENQRRIEISEKIRDKAQQGSFE